MQSDVSLQPLQVPVSRPYPDPNPSSPCSPSHVMKIYLNIISHLCQDLPSGLFPSGFTHQNSVCTSSPPIRATCSTRFILLDLMTPVMSSKEYKSLGYSCSLLHSPVTASLLGPNILLNTLFSNTLNLRSCLNVNDRVSQSHRTTGKIIVLYIPIFTFWIANWKTKNSAPNNGKYSLN
jgi:hypothetical protein